MADQNPNANNKAVANLLLKEGLATKEQIQKAIAHQKNSDKNPSLLRVLVGMKVLDKEAAQQIQAKMKSAAAPAPAKPTEAPKASSGGFSFAEDDADILAREKKAGNLGVQMFDGNADISGFDLAEDDSDKIMKKKADYFEPVEAAAKKQNAKNQQQAQKKKKKAPIDPNDLRCQNCGAKVKENQRRCRDCGMPLDLDELRSRPQDMSKKHWKMYVIPAVVLIVVAIAVIFFMGEKQSHDEEEARKTAEADAQKQKDKNNRKASQLRDRVAAIEQLDTWKEQESESLLCEKLINDFCEKTGFSENLFEAQFKTIEKYKTQAEEERKKIEEAKNKKNDDDEDDDEEADDDDDDDDEDLSDTKKMTPLQQEKYDKFKVALEDLFTAYKSGWTEPSKEFNDAMGRLSKTAFNYSMQYLIDTMLNEEPPVAALPEVTNEDGDINHLVEPWGICIQLIIAKGKSLKSQESKDKKFNIFKKYLARYPYYIVSNIRAIGKEYTVQLSEFLHDETVVDNPKHMDQITYAKTNLINALLKLDEKYDDQVFELLLPMLDNTNIDWAQKALYWLINNVPEKVVDKVVEWLKSEDDKKSGYAKLRIRDLARNDNCPQETKTLYAEAIIKLIENDEKPNIEHLKLVLELDKDKGDDVLIPIMKNRVTVEDDVYFKSILVAIRDAYRSELMKYYPMFIEDNEVCVEYRRWFLDEMIKRSKEEHFKDIMDMVFRLLENENDELNPLEIIIKMLADAAKAGKVNLKEYWPKFKVFFDKHNRKDGFELFMAMHLCDSSKSMDEALNYIFDDKADDGSRAKNLDWVAKNESSDVKVLEYSDKIMKSATKPGIQTLKVIEMIKVDLLFKKCSNDDFEALAPRQNKAAIDSPYSTLLAIDKKGSYYITVSVIGTRFKVYSLRNSSYTEVKRKELSEAWTKFKKDKAEWDALEKKGDKLEPKPPSGEEIDYKDQIVSVSISSPKQIRFLTAKCNIEFWTTDATSYNPAVKDGPKYPGYCTKVVSLTDKIKELKGLSLTADNIVASGDGNIIAVKIAGSDALIIDINRSRLISKISPGSFAVMKLDAEGERILFYGGENNKASVYEVNKPDKGLVINMEMKRHDYAGFGADRKTILVSNDGFLWRFDMDTGEKNSVYIVPALIVDSFYYTFIMDDGKYFGEVRKNQIRIREIKNGKTEAAVGKIDDPEVEVTPGRIAVSEDGKVIVVLMMDHSTIVHKIG